MDTTSYSHLLSTFPIWHNISPHKKYQKRLLRRNVDGNGSHGLHTSLILMALSFVGSYMPPISEAQGLGKRGLPRGKTSKAFLQVNAAYSWAHPKSYWQECPWVMLLTCF